MSGGFTDQFIDQVRDATTLSEVLGQYVTWDAKKTKARRGDYWSCCPFHGEDTASFHADDRRGRYHCFGCGVSGDAIQFLIDSQALTFPEAVTNLAERAGIQVPQPSPEAQAKADRRAQALDAMASAALWFKMQLSGEFGMDALDYLKERGLTSETIGKFAIGYAPSKGGLYEHLYEKGYDKGLLVAVGILGQNEDGSTYERFRGRVIFPVHDLRGRVIAFGGRAMPGAKKQIAKYINSPATPLFDKSRVIYNAHRARPAAHEAGRLLVEEGYLDVCMSDQAGFDYCVAPMGTAITADQLEACWKLADEPIICLDGDEAGRQAARKVIDLALPQIKSATSLKFMQLPVDADPADILADGETEEFERLIAQAEPLHEFQFQSLIDEAELGTPEREASFVSRVMEVLSRIGDGQVRQLYAKRYQTKIAQQLKIKVKLKLATVTRRRAAAAESNFSKPSQESHNGEFQTLFKLEQIEQKGGFDLDVELARYDLTDLGNAKRFIARNGHRFRYCLELGWLAWDGTRWQMDGAEKLVDRAVHETVMAIRDEAQALVSGEVDGVVSMNSKNEPTYASDLVLIWCMQAQSNAHIRCIHTLASSYLSVSTDQLDANPMRINVRNGTLHIYKNDHGEPYVQLRDHDPLDNITKLANVSYELEAKCPEYDAFLDEVQPDVEMRRYLHRWGGLSLTGDARPQKLHFWYGKGGNGKSVLLNAWAACAGDYCDTVPIETFLNQGRARRGGDPTPDLAVLAGVRFLRTSEPDKGSKLNEALIKLATGEEPMRVRHLNKDLFTLIVQFKLTISGNYRPQISGTDDGIWRRMVLVPWSVQIPEERRDMALGERLEREASGILNRMLDGLCDFLDTGLEAPQAVLDATNQYRTDSDPLGQFLSECTADDDQERVQGSVLYGVFKAWAHSVGEKEWTNTGFGRALRDKGFKSKQSNVRWWLGIKLIKQASDFVSEDDDDRPKGPPPPTSEDDYE